MAPARRGAGICSRPGCPRFLLLGGPRRSTGLLQSLLLVSTRARPGRPEQQDVIGGPGGPDDPIASHQSPPGGRSLAPLPYPGRQAQSRREVISAAIHNTVVPPTKSQELSCLISRKILLCPPFATFSTSTSAKAIARFGSRLTAIGFAATPADIAVLFLKDKLAFAKCASIVVGSCMFPSAMLRECSAIRSR